MEIETGFCNRLCSPVSVPMSSIDIRSVRFSLGRFFSPLRPRLHNPTTSLAILALILRVALVARQYVTALFPDFLFPNSSYSPRRARIKLHELKELEGARLSIRNAKCNFLRKIIDRWEGPDYTITDLILTGAI